MNGLKKQFCISAGSIAIAAIVVLALTTTLAWTQAAATTIDIPGATSTIVWAINPQGDIVGQYTSAGVVHGFLVRRGVLSTIDVPGARRTVTRGINARGEIVGMYTDAAGMGHGFLLSDGIFTAIDVPSARSTFGALGINSRGDIVGSYTDSASVDHGFLLSRGMFTTIDFPGTNFTRPTGITDGGEAVPASSVASC